MKHNRTMANKAYMTEQQHNNLVADARAVRKSVSTLLCDCYEEWRDRKSQGRPVTRPTLAPFRAKFPPPRAARPQMHVRMRN